MASTHIDALQVSSKNILVTNKVELVKWLSEDLYILQHAQADGIINDRVYKKLKNTPQPEDVCILLIDTVIGGGEKVSSQFLKLLKKTEILNTYPQLKKLNSLPDRRAFFIKNREALVQRIKNVESIVDDLISAGFHAELASSVRAETTDPERMRQILDSVFSNALAEVLFNALLEHQKDVMMELQGPTEPKISESLSVPDKQLSQVWSAFTQKASDPVQLLIDLIVNLLDETWTEEDKRRLLDRCTTPSEMARVLFDEIVPKKRGQKNKIMSYLKIRDYELYSGLGLSSDLASMTGSSSFLQEGQAGATTSVLPDATKKVKPMKTKLVKGSPEEEENEDSVPTERLTEMLEKVKIESEEEEEKDESPLTSEAPKMDTKEMKSEHIEQDSKEEEGRHASHSFAFSIGKAESREITCTKAQTILDALLTSSFFSRQKNAKKVKDKECVILRGKKAIPTHFPCWLIEKDDLLIIEYIKAEGHSEPPKSVVGSPQLNPVVFHVKTEGDKNTKFFLNNTNLKPIADEVSVYAFEGETVEEALRRDGRFKIDVFSKCSLINISNDIITEMSICVNNLDGKTFKIKRDDKYPALKSQSNQPVPCTSTSPSTSTKCITSPSSVTFTSTSTSSQQQSATNVSEHTARRNTAPSWAQPCPIENSKEILNLLRAQFKDLLKHMQDREGKSKIKELFRVEYGKSDNMCKTVKMQKQLMIRADSVCQVRVEGIPAGSGFLLFKKFILTNAHVIARCYDDDRKQLTQEVTVSFCYEDQKSKADSVAVKPEVVVSGGDSASYQDWALLELDLADAQKYPPGLLRHVRTSRHEGGICIIGHPDGDVKKTDPCFIVPVGDREQVVYDRCEEVKEQHIITHRYFDEDGFERLSSNYPLLAYDTCFSEGSSGSPVFDEFCNVVGMHTGGFVYKYETKKGQPLKVGTRSFIEYGQPLSRIVPRLIIQIVERKRFDVLEAYRQYTSDHPNAKWKHVNDAVNRIVACMKDNTVYKENMANYERQREIASIELMETD